jgi:hypothetical protein
VTLTVGEERGGVPDHATAGTNRLRLENVTSKILSSNIFTHLTSSYIYIYVFFL